MTSQADDPLGRVLTILSRLEIPDVDALAWQELQGTLLLAQAERAALMAVVQEARDLVEAIGEYEEAVEAGKVDLLDELGEACVAAEDALVDALDRADQIQSGEAEPSREQAFHAALDRLEDEDDEEPSH